MNEKLSPYRNVGAFLLQKMKENRSLVATLFHIKIMVIDIFDESIQNMHS